MHYTIPDDWLTFVRCPTGRAVLSIHPISPAELSKSFPFPTPSPTRRDAGVISFKKYKMCPVLFAFQLPECALPPVVVEFMSASQAFRYRIVNGFHRFYASVHVGYTHIPVDIWGAWTSDRLFLEISIPEPSLIYLGLLFKSTKPLLYSN